MDSLRSASALASDTDVGGLEFGVLASAELGVVIASAGSVVSGTVPPNSVVLGNPVKVIFMRR